MSDIATNGRPVFYGPPTTLAVRVPEELATYLELLASINERSKTDEYRVALENYAVAAKADKKVQERIKSVMEEIDAEAKAKREVLSSMLGDERPAAKTSASKPSTPKPSEASAADDKAATPDR